MASTTRRNLEKYIKDFREDPEIDQQDKDAVNPGLEIIDTPQQLNMDKEKIKRKTESPKNRISN